MARDHSRIRLSIWTDPAFLALDRDAQRMYLVLVSQPRLSYCGVLDYVPARLARLAPDEDEASVDHAVKLLEADRFVVVDRSTQELLIRSFVRHDGLLKTPNVTKAMVSARALVMSEQLRDVIDAELARAYQEDPTMAGWAGSGSQPGGLLVADVELYAKVIEPPANGSPKGSAATA